MHWKTGVLLRVLFLMSLFCCSQTEVLGQTGSPGESSAGKNTKKQPATKPVQTPKKVGTKSPKPTPEPPKPTPEPPKPAPAPSSPAPNEVDMGVREVDISCPFADYEWKDGQRRCKDPRFSTFNNAEDIAKRLEQAVAGLHVRNIDDHRLLISWKGKMPEHALEELERLIQQEAAPGGADPDENRVIRLYNNRNATKVAEAVKDLFEGVDASAIGDDVIFLKGKGDPSKHPFSNIDRMVARMDLPRPQVTLNVWSLQLSSKDPVKLNDDAKKVQEKIGSYDVNLGDALRSGWNQMVQDWNVERKAVPAAGSLSTPEQEPAQAFRDYVAKLSLSCDEGMDIPTCKKNSKLHLEEGQICQKDHYCLGFIDSFDLTTPSLTRMLLLLAASDNPKNMSAGVVRAMQTSAPEPQMKGETKCEAKCEAKPILSFTKFQAELNRLEGPRLGALRAAYADFLFSY